MKVAAHPLLVAAAFGLLGPAAMDDRDELVFSDENGWADCGGDDQPDAVAVAALEQEWAVARKLTST